MASPRYDLVVERISGRRPRCGNTTVIAVDGPSGSGKTELVAGVATATGAEVLHLEDLYPGWQGLAATPPVVAAVLGAVAVGTTGTACRWDWQRAAPGELVDVHPSALLILDGVGSGAAVIRPYLSFLVWVEASVDVRRRRALARDGDVYAPHWDGWAEQEAAHFEIEQTRRHADLVVRT